MQPNSHQQQFTKSQQFQPIIQQPLPENKTTLKQQLDTIYKKFFTQNNNPSSPAFEQIDHGPKELCSELFSIQENCLVISYQAFERYYESLFKTLRQEEDVEETLRAANVLLAMNGQNDRAWNIKKKYLLLQSFTTPKEEGQHLLEQQQQAASQSQYLKVSWQLVFNAAVCLKCKKSSSYYEYRLRLIQAELNQLLLQESIEIGNIKELIGGILERENKLIGRVLARYFRNYFCWMYRVKLVKLIHERMLLVVEEVGESNSKEQMAQGKDSLMEAFLLQQLQYIHKFLEKYCNDYSGYSYLIAFFQKYIIAKSLQTNQKQQIIGSIERQISWAEELKEYCEVAYDSDQHYKHLLMYCGHLKKLQEKYQL